MITYVKGKVIESIPVQVLRLTREGKSAWEIARNLGIGERYVDKIKRDELNNIFQSKQLSSTPTSWWGNIKTLTIHRVNPMDVYDLYIDSGTPPYRDIANILNITVQDVGYYLGQAEILRKKYL